MPCLNLAYGAYPQSGRSAAPPRALAGAAGELREDAVERGRDFGLTWNSVVDGRRLLVGNRVDLQLDVSAVRRA
jgi:hypothetical protein